MVKVMIFNVIFNFCFLIAFIWTSSFFSLNIKILIKVLIAETELNNFPFTLIMATKLCLLSKKKSKTAGSKLQNALILI